MDVVGNVSLGDVQEVWKSVRKIDGNPLRLAGRLAGLSGAEMDAGVPTWAWVVIAFGAGAALTYAYGERASRQVKELF